MGNYTNVINISTGVNKSVDLGSTAKDANKVNIITPRVKGFQLGLSFTPNIRQGDEKPRGLVNADSSATVSSPFTKNNFEGSLNYIHKCAHDLTMKMSLSGVYAKAQRGSTEGPAGFPRHDAKSYAIGTVIEYKNFAFGAEFIDNGRALARKDLIGQNAGQVYSTGMSLALGKNTYSFGYLHSTRSLGQIVHGLNVINPSAKTCSTPCCRTQSCTWT